MKGLGTIVGDETGAGKGKKIELHQGGARVLRMRTTDVARPHRRKKTTRNRGERSRICILHGRKEGAWMGAEIDRRTKAGMVVVVVEEDGETGNLELGAGKVEEQLAEVIGWRGMLGSLSLLTRI